ncbi:glycosyltransferase [Stieleria sp. TO1_6]|uniref:glycosyltransferase n=1 Tax=Stieleria tagensis TaxID=2956795 RepID=UPI00209AA0E9|nr:glycosyltransferase family 2 protein [Stieleria tagensis]MCO8120961.1 glycosyltransferase [Stieleria tagensis]
MILLLAIIGLGLSTLPLVMLLANLPLFCDQTTNDATDRELPPVSVLVPARDEADSISNCIDSALASKAITIEVIVLDDQSTDATPAIVHRYADMDPRVRLVRGKPLPPGWNGKQYACAQLADAARYEHLLFLDADVRLSADAIRKLAQHLDDNDAGLLSAFPHQITGTWLEKWLIPMMHFILLGYLPFARMRRDCQPSLAAGCGQLFLTTRQSYDHAGTHAAIKSSRHDGVKLPRAYRAAGIMTDVIDGSDLAECRMYQNTRQVVRGLMKNASEGIANPRLIIVFTVLLLGCSLLPLAGLVVAVVGQHWTATAICVVALVVAHLPRLIAAAQFRQSWLGACCHLPATFTFVALQWFALGNQLLGRQVAWRGRVEN